MHRIGLTPMTMTIDGLGTESAGKLAAKAVTMGARAAAITTSEALPPSLLLTIQFPDGGEGRAVPTLLSLLQFAALVQDVPVDQLLERAKGQ